MAEKKTSWGTYALGALAAACLFRGLWRPFRQPMDHSRVGSCESIAECSNDLLIESTSGTSNVYALGSGQATVEGSSVLVALANEPVVLRYDLPGDAALLVRDGKVGLGQRIATAGRLTFSVWRINQDGSYTPLSPSAWLVSRGMRVADSGSGWCMTGRRLTLPALPNDCALRLPSPGSLAVLPISVEVQ